LSSPPESLWSIYGLSPSCLNDDRFRRKTLPFTVCPGLLFPPACTTVLKFPCRK
jgi:hypothetical protein